jgi:hypothetical protein
VCASELRKRQRGCSAGANEVGPAVSAVAVVLASGVQGGGADPSPARDTLIVLGVIAVLALVGVLVFMHLRRRARRRRPVGDQWQALTVMGELCPHGWQAQITLYGWNAPVPADAPPSRVPLVELEWKQFEEEAGRVAVARRVWAPTIDAALQSMIDDRRTDIALEEIERAAEGDGDFFWDG